MPFQTSVSDRIPNGIPGEMAFHSPDRGAPGLLSSATPANNVFGRAFTIETNPANVLSEGTRVVAGGTGAFYGILANPKEHVLLSGSAFEPEFTLPNGAVGSFMSMGQIYVQLANAAVPGNEVIFAQATGILSAQAAGATPGAGSTLIKNAKVIRYIGSVTTPYNGLAVVQLTD